MKIDATKKITDTNNNNNLFATNAPRNNDHMMFNNNNNNINFNENPDRTIPNLRASAAAKAKATAAAVNNNFQGYQAKPNNEKQADLM